MNGPIIGFINSLFHYLKTFAMARIFSINFNHDGITETAMVTVRQDSVITEYEVNIPNAEIAVQLPMNVMVSHNRHGLYFLNTKKEEYTDLMHELVKVVQEHLESLAV